MYDKIIREGFAKAVYSSMKHKKVNKEITAGKKKPQHLAEKKHETYKKMYTSSTLPVTAFTLS